MFSPGAESERADAGRGSQTHLARPEFSGANRRGRFVLAFYSYHKEDWRPCVRLVPNLLNVMMTLIHIYKLHIDLATFMCEIEQALLLQKCAAVVIKEV